MKFTDIFIERPVLATVFSLLILLFGLRGLTTLELRQFPKMENATITVTTRFVGASAELIQGFITSPLEKKIATAGGLDYITSSSAEGISTITAYIRINYNPDIAMTDIMAKVAEAQNQLPRESEKPVITKSANKGGALMYLGYSSTSMNNQEITEYLSRFIQPNLQTVPGVASANILGGFPYAMRIWLDTNKMASLQISAQDVRNALITQNIQAPAGQTKGKYVLFNINAKTNLETPEQFGNITIKTNNNTIVRLKDIAKVELGAETYDASVKFNGKSGVFIGIEGSPGSNPLDVVNGVKKMLPDIEVNYPPSLNGMVVYDSTTYISNSIDEVRTSIIEATLIVVFVIFAFIGSVRAVTIPIVTIPLSLIGVCSLMYAMGYSINTLTLLAMVIAIGLVVDDAIVVVENIIRHIEEGLTPTQAALKGAHEITMPVISMTITLAAVYAPIGFMSGLTGALFKEFAFTLAFSVILSGVIALTLSPMMCSKILSEAMTHEKLVVYIDSLFERLKNQYQQRLQFVLTNRKVMAVFAMLMLIGCALMAYTTKSELAPGEDQSFIFMSLEVPRTANIDYTEKFTDLLSPIFKSFPETDTYFVINGEEGVNAIAGLILKPINQRKLSQQKVLEALQPKLAAIAGINAAAFPMPSLPSAAGGLPIQFVMTSTEDYVVLYQVIEQLLASAQKSGLFMFVNSDLTIEKPVLQVDIDHNKAAVMGISMENIADTLSSLLGGNYTNRFSLSGQSYQVISQVSQDFRLNPDLINNFYLKTNDGKLVPLSTIVTLRMKTEANQLMHFQQINAATLSGIMMPGVSITDALQFLKNEALKIMPVGFSFDYSGQSRQVIQEGSAMIYTFFFALIIIYLVLAAQFESFRDPFIILISVPLSITGALLPLHVGFATLNIYTGIGLVTLIGLISKHGILMVSFANQLQEREKLSINEAILKSASLRLRPILMTTVAMVLGVVPLLIASGAGAASRFNIGLVIAAGMTFGTCFTLFVVPAMYSLLAKKM